MAKLQELFDEKRNVVASMRDMAKAVQDNKYTPEQDAQFQRADARLKEIDQQIEVLKRAQQLEDLENVNEGERQTPNDVKPVQATSAERHAVLAKIKDQGEKALSDHERGIKAQMEKESTVFRKWMTVGMENLNSEEKAMMRARQERAQSIGTPSAGGYTVPEGFSGYIVERLKFISQLLNWANIMTTETGNPIPFPYNDDTSNVGELIGENADLSSSSADLVFSVFTLSAYKLSSKMIKVSNELLQDNGVNLEQYLGKQLATRVGRIFNTYGTTGTGISQPQGYITGATQGKVSASATAFTADELIDLMHSVDAAYRTSPKCAWAFHDLVLANIKKLSNSSSDDRPLWLPSIRESEPDTLYGKPYFVNNAMASTLATGNKVVAFGDWDYFAVRMVNAFSLKRLNERYAEYDQAAFFGLARMDTRVMDTNAIKYLELT